MASIYTRTNSKFLWIRFRDADGKRAAVSTGIDKRLPGARKRAQNMLGEKRLEEASRPAINEREAWEAWAAIYIEERYANTGSHTNATVALRDLLAFFIEKGIRTPRMVTYDHACAFVPWRVSHKTLDKVKVNTARLRFVYFRILMAEAVRRKFAPFNPCRDVRNKGEPSKKKEEITIDDEKKIESLLEKYPQWMRDQWLVMMRQGCRIAETRCDMDRINTDAMTITFRIKGGRFHTAGLHPDLLPIIARARNENRKTLIEGGPNDSARWCDFFTKHKRSERNKDGISTHYSAHCCRVTVITRLLRAGHSPALVSSFIGHTEEVNTIYRRLKPPDSSALLVTLAGAPNPVSHSDTP